jgi:phage terminase Nu1 subunit (DNA packaging protein)
MTNNVGVTSADLAQLWACTSRQVELLAQKGIAVRLGHGRYHAAMSTRNYVCHLREMAAGRLDRNDAVLHGIENSGMLVDGLE